MAKCAEYAPSMEKGVIGQNHMLGVETVKAK